MLAWLRTVKSVLWGFFGVRRGRGYDQDIANNKPVPLILTGLFLAACFVLLLVWVARMAVHAAL